MRSTLRSVLLLAIAAILPICAFAFMTAATSVRQEREAVERAALEQVQLISNQVDREILAQLDMVSMLSQLPGLDPGGDLSTVDEVLRRLQRERPLWLAALVAERDGTIVVDTQLPLPGRVVDMASLAKVVESKKPLIGNIVRGSTGPGLPIRAPVIRGDEVRYVISIVIRPDAFRDLLRSSGIPEGWVAGIVDHAGRLAGRSRGDSEMIGQSAAPSVLEARQRGGQGFHEGRTLDGQDVVTAYRVSPVTGWSVHLGIPTEVFEGPVRSRLWLVIAGAAVAAFLAALFTWLLIRDISVRRRDAAAMESMRRLESLGRLTGRVAHDFNNLLTAILGGVTMLRRRVREEGAGRFLDVIERAAEKGGQATRDLLMFAKGGHSDPKPTDVNDHIHNSLGVLCQSLPATVRIDLDLADGLPLIRVDPVQLDLALLNLVSNARDALKGEGVIRIQTSLENGSIPQRVVLTVSDNGVGIASDVLPYVFEPFFTTKGGDGGTGLGLSQVYGFAKQSGGQVEIKSMVAEGTTVRLALPAHGKPEIDAQAKPPAVPTMTGPGVRVLLVDDNADVRATIASYLRDSGHVVLEAEDAAQALPRLEEIDLLVTDIIMPGSLNGVELAKEAARRRPGLKIVLITGFSEARLEAVEAGWTVLQKPFGFDELETLVASVATEGIRSADQARV
jgi:signal transduction histidine kinase/ActR/RegA family two-component response regulator